MSYGDWGDQSCMARQLGITRHRLSDYLAGRRRIGAETAKKLALRLGRPKEWPKLYRLSGEALWSYLNTS